MKTKMRDGLIQRGAGRWTAALTLGYSEPDPVTGKRRILTKWISLGKCTRQQARRSARKCSSRCGRTSLWRRPSAQSVGGCRRMEPHRSGWPELADSSPLQGSQLDDWRRACVEARLLDR